MNKHNEETFDKLRDIIYNLTIIPTDFEILPLSRLSNDLGLDSLDVIDLMMSIEEEFKIELESEVMKKCKTIQDVMDLIKGKLESR